MTAPDSLIWAGLLPRAAEPDGLGWQPFRAGIDICRLAQDGDDGAAAALLRYQPGASVPLHVHTGHEYVLVLSGAQTDHNGTHRAGTLVVNPPGSRHTVESPEGCTVLIVWEKPVQILDEDS
jgi:anti-sigma factor ChrR (cupin superfamily)